MGKHIGVTSLAGIKDRCRIDTITGCWNWAWCKSRGQTFETPAVHLGAGVAGMTKHTTLSTYRAAWLLAGKSIEPGNVVYRTCCNPDCCNPAHLAQGTRAEMHGHYAATGRYKGQPHRRVANAKNRAKLTTPRERVQQVEAMLAAGKMVKEIKEELQIASKTIQAIRERRHPNCSQPARQQIIRGASVFEMGAV
jgi:DNA-binding CsgD family transcriptional regulator